MARDYNPVPQLSQKLSILFTHADFVYRRYRLQVERGITFLSTAIGLRESYLSEHKGDDELREAVEQALLLRYGIGPVDDLRAIQAASAETDPSSVKGAAAESWDAFHRVWPFWREGDAAAFNRNLMSLDPRPLPIGAEPLSSAIEVVKRTISRRRNPSSTLSDVPDAAEDKTRNLPAASAPPQCTDDKAGLFDSPTDDLGGSHGPPSHAIELSRAFHYASSLSTIPRASGSLTISHLMQVAGIVLENGGSEDEAIAAFLHDAAEDYGEDQISHIARLFNENVAEIVRECSDSFKRPGIHREPWFPRKKRFLEKLPRKSVSAMKVIVADKLHNARAMLRDGRAEGEEFWAKLKRTPEETTAYFAVAQRILAARHPSAPTSELAIVVAMLEASFCNPSLLGEKITAFSRDIRW